MATTAEHRFLTPDGYVPQALLTVGSKVGVAPDYVPGYLKCNGFDRHTAQLDGAGDIRWDRVEAITRAAPAATIDFEIKTHHNFVLNGVVVHNSTSLATTGVLRSLVRPHTNTLYIAPLFEMTRRFSSNSVAELISQSFWDRSVIGSPDANVLQRTFPNGSKMFFSYALLNADRVRGIQAAALDIDECQDVDPKHLPTILGCLGASKFPVIKYSGTPKTSSTLLHKQWMLSSQAAWVVKCEPCGHWNICNADHDIEKMIGKEGVVCANCQRAINPRHGAWYHFYKDRIQTFPGYHLPQPILPMHYGIPEKWALLRQNMLTMPRNGFLNEILGETCDVGSRLVTLDDLRAASGMGLTHEHDDLQRASELAGNYPYVAMGVDWSLGGGGRVVTKNGRLKVEDGTASFTAVCVLGFDGIDMGKADLLYGAIIPSQMSPSRAVKTVMEIYRACRCRILAHDYGGGGFVYEDILREHGMPEDHTMPCQYTHAPKANIVQPQPVNENRSRWSYSVDKTRSLVMTCAMLQRQKIRFPLWTTGMEELSKHFMSFVESRTTSRFANDTYLILQSQDEPSDFAHAVNLALVGAWNQTGSYPAMTRLYGLYQESDRIPDVAPHAEDDYD